MEKQGNDNFKEKIYSISEELLKQQADLKKKAVEEAEKDEDQDTIDLGDVLFKGVSDCIKDLTKHKKFTTSLKELIDSGVLKSEKDLENFTTIISSITISAVYNTILLYDDLLKDELQKQFDHVADHINLAKSDIEALKAVVQIHGKELTQMKSSSEINKFKEENGIK